MKFPIRFRLPRSRRALRRLGRFTAYLALVVVALLIAAYAAARIYLPEIVARKADVEAMLTQLTQHDVRIGALEPYWDGLHPGVRALDVSVYADDGQAKSIRVAEARASLALLPLLWGAVKVHTLILSRPALTLMRRADVRIHVAGFEPGSGPDTVASWALQQRRIVVEQGELRWIDALDATGPLALSHVELSLYNAGKRHKLAASARFPEAMCGECSLLADLRGPMDGTLNGELSVQVKNLNAVALPAIVRAHLPTELRGRFGAKLWSDWQDGRPRLVRGEATVTGLRLALPEVRRPLHLPQASAEIAWETTDDGWRLDLARPTLTLAGRPWSAGRVRVDHTDKDNRVHVKHVELNELTAFLAAYRSEHPWLQRWAELHPDGVVNDLQVRLSGSFDAPDDYDVSAQLVNVSIASDDHDPSFRRLSGRVSFDKTAGELMLDANDLALHLPQVLRAPIETRRASGMVRWQRQDSAWRVSATDLRIQGDDGEGSGMAVFEWPHDRALSPVLHLRVAFRNVNSAHAARYYPARHLPPDVLAWMESAFVSGRVTSGHLIYDGAIRDWPFENGPGRFELRARVRDAVYRFLPGWTPISQIEADVAVDGPNVLVSGQGKIGTLKAREVRVEVRGPLGTPQRVISIRGQLAGPIAETVRVLKTAEDDTSDWPAYARLIAHAAGDAALDLDMRIPLDGNAARAFNAGYRFKDATLKLSSGAGLQAATGTLRLSESGLQEGRFQGRLFGGPLTFTANRSNGELRVDASGQLLPSELLRARRSIAERVTGTANWSFALHDRRTGPQLRFESDLKAVRTRLPPPLNRPDGIFNEPLVISTESSRPDALVLALRAGSAMGGKLALVHEKGAWRLQNGRIELGKPTAVLSRRSGLELGVTADALDMDQWLPMIGDAPTGESPVAVSAISADIKQLDLFDRRWGRTLVHFIGSGSEWRTVLAGDAVAGEGSFTPAAAKTPHRIRLDLAYLRLPERRETAVETQPVDPRHLPALDLRARSFEYQGRKFGELDFSAAPYDQGWRIGRLELTRPEMRLGVRGVWRISGERHASDLTIELDSEDMGKTLDEIGTPGQMVDGKTRVRAKLAWPNTPTQPTFAGLDGNVEVSAERGRFLKFDPGAARLFGLLDLHSIGRYLTLDFSPAFGRGFAFDVIHGNVTLERGNAYTSDFIVKGPSLALGASGRVGLAAEDYDLVIEASPKISDTLTLTSWGLFGPQVAAAVLAFQKIFQRQIEEGTRVTYIVKGPWDSPQVTKLGRPPAQSDEPFAQ